ncbi:DUF4350 domain-containing protein [Leucothrix sargassi]|nr:DUF4350 domain-containing protein [Leucothrix sargassi]
MLSRKETITLVIATLIVSALTFAFFHYYERVEVKRFKPLTGEASSNPLFASRLFLKRMGIPTQSVTRLPNPDFMPSRDSVIILTAQRHRMSDVKVDQLLDWVNQGGHLIVPTNEYWADRSFYEFDEELVQENSEAVNTQTNYDRIQSALGVHVDADEHIEFEAGESRAIQLPHAPKPLEVQEDHYHAIILDSDNDAVKRETVTLEGRNFLIRQSFGDGFVTLISSLDFIKYNNLTDYDHAEILWYLVHRDASKLNTPEQVWLVRSGDSPNLFTLIWQRFWPLVLMLTVLFIAWAMRASRRFGPLIEKQNEDRRQLMDHIEASGGYYWKQKQSDTLIHSTRAALNQRASQRIPGWQQMSKEAQASTVAEQLSLDPKHVFHALHSNINHSPHDFTEIIKQLEYIRTNV